MVVLSNNSMWYHINNGMGTKSNRNDNVTLRVMDGKTNNDGLYPKVVES